MSPCVKGGAKRTPSIWLDTYTSWPGLQVDQASNRGSFTPRPHCEKLGLLMQELYQGIQCLFFRCSTYGEFADWLIRLGDDICSCTAAFYTAQQVATERIQPSLHSGCRMPSRWYWLLFFPLSMEILDRGVEGMPYKPSLVVRVHPWLHSHIPY